MLEAISHGIRTLFVRVIYGAAVEVCRKPLLGLWSQYYPTWRQAVDTMRLLSEVSESCDP